MKGYRTIIAMVLALAFSIMASQGWVVPESDQAAIQSGIVAFVSLVMRLCTTGPVGGGR